MLRGTITLGRREIYGHVNDTNDGTAGDTIQPRLTEPVLSPSFSTWTPTLSSNETSRLVIGTS
jgi:hypothetical protein